MVNVLRLSISTTLSSVTVRAGDLSCLVVCSAASGAALASLTVGDGTDLEDIVGDGTDLVDTVGDEIDLAETVGNGTDLVESVGDGVDLEETVGDGADLEKIVGDGAVLEENVGEGAALTDKEEATLVGWSATPVVEAARET